MGLYSPNNLLSTQILKQRVMEKQERRSECTTKLSYTLCMADVPKVPQYRTKEVIRKYSKHYRARRATSHHLPSHQLQSQRTLLLRLT